MFDVCETTNYVYPLLADVFYPVIEQGAYGNVSKEWTLDSVIPCAFGPLSTKGKKDVLPQDVNIKIDQVLVGRTKKDIRISSELSPNSVTNVIITNIRDVNGNHIYVETAGPRVGLSTIFEIATIEPIVGAFGKVEYYKVVIRRSDNQAETV